MYVRQPSPLEPRTSKKPQTPQRQRSPRRLGRTEAIALESMAKMTVNFVLAVTATTGLFRLVPYHLSVQEKMVQLQTEVNRTEERVNRLRSEFDRAFDPQETAKLMQEQSHRVNANSKRRPVVWMDSPSAESRP